jgi:hypothetical protein
MIKKENIIFKIKKDYLKAIDTNRKFKRKFIKLKKSICKNNQTKEKDFNCIFHVCDKVFPNYTRWMLHYKMHVRNVFIFHILFKAELK